MYVGLRGFINMAGNVSLSLKFVLSRHYIYCTYRLRYINIPRCSFGATATSPALLICIPSRPPASSATSRLKERKRDEQQLLSTRLGGITF